MSEKLPELTAPSKFPEWVRMNSRYEIVAFQGFPGDEGGGWMRDYLRADLHDSALRAEREKREAAVYALRLLLAEVDASGNGNARDFGWPEALKAARQALAADASATPSEKPNPEPGSGE